MFNLRYNTRHPFSVRCAFVRPRIYAYALCVNALHTMRRNDHRRSQSSDRHAKCARARSLMKCFIISCLPIFLRCNCMLLHNIRHSFAFLAQVQRNSATSILLGNLMPQYFGESLEFLYFKFYFSLVYLFIERSTFILYFFTKNKKYIYID